MPHPHCRVCGGILPTGGCLDCQRQYPPSLLRATVHDSSYVAGLTSGRFFAFRSATVHGETVTLRGVQAIDGPDVSVSTIDVRISCIEWTCEVDQRIGRPM